MDCLLFLKGNLLTSGPELDMIWTDRTGDGKERQRRRMLRTAEALPRIWNMLEDLEIRIWNMLATPPGRPLASLLMATDQWLKDDRQLVQMAFG